jgi:hypothetical protein
MVNVIRVFGDFMAANMIILWPVAAAPSRILR